MAKTHRLMVKIPHPGSDEAIDAGCLCPVSDNEYGRGYGVGENGALLFWRDDACPLHGQKAVKGNG